MTELNDDHKDTQRTHQSSMETPDRNLFIGLWRHKYYRNHNNSIMSNSDFIKDALSPKVILMEELKDSSLSLKHYHKLLGESYYDCGCHDFSHFNKYLFYISFGSYYGQPVVTLRLSSNTEIPFIALRDLLMGSCTKLKYRTVVLYSDGVISSWYDDQYLTGYITSWVDEFHFYDVSYGDYVSKRWC